MVQRVTTGILSDGDVDLVARLGEELKQPLINIMHMAELGAKDVLISAQAKKALNTIDNVLLYRRFVTGQLSLHTEPIHVGGTIVQVANKIEPQMRMNGCTTEISIQHSLQPASIDRRVMTSALLGMWQAFIDSIHEPQEVVCSAHMVPNGIRLSLLSEGASLEQLSLSSVSNKSSQPIVGVAGPATDLLTAYRMFELVGGKLTKSKRSGMVGIGVTLPISKQTQLV